MKKKDLRKLLYFSVQSMCGLLQIELRSGEELVALLKEEKEFEDTVLGTLHFTLCRDDRIEVCVPEEGTVYVYERVPSLPFLESVIELFKNNHHLTIEKICACFAQFGICIPHSISNRTWIRILQPLCC